MGWVDVAEVINSFSKHISTFSRTVSKNIVKFIFNKITTINEQKL